MEQQVMLVLQEEVMQKKGKKEGIMESLRKEEGNLCLSESNN